MMGTNVVKKTYRRALGFHLRLQWRNCLFLWRNFNCLLKLEVTRSREGLKYTI